MMSTFFSRLVFLSLFSFVTSFVRADPLTVDVSTVPSPHSVDLGQGMNTDPSGHVLTGDSQTLYLDGKPFVPIVGEFHYARYPRQDWRDELLKMKAGGLNTVSTYVFWIHQEEIKGKFDWTDRRSLREFLQLCQKVGLKAIVRLGPFDHGETRNGGLPDWVVKSGVPLRSNTPAFLDLVHPFYDQIAKQMKGLLWKDGGPVIGVQLDNESGDVPYLFALKKMAQDAGIDVPYYLITGWNGVAVPSAGLLPEFGGYPDAFWGGDADSYSKFYVFTPVRDDGDMGANLADYNANRNQNAQRFPYLCCENGGGMASSVTRRIVIAPEDVAALALVKVGNGCNMTGYYMYQGGINPDGQTHFDEESPNPMPVKDYDFQAPLGSCGEVRGQYHLLREQNLFLLDFGALLAPMPAFFPDKMPTGVRDKGTVRWSVRSDGNSGFLFVNNYSRYDQMPDQVGTQFSVKTKNGTLLIPSEPLTIPADDFGIWPFNLDCAGVPLTYATAQPLARIDWKKSHWYFFKALSGVDPDFSFGPTTATFEPGTAQIEKSNGTYRIHHVTPGTAPVGSFSFDDGTSVHFVVLSPEQARQLWRGRFDDRDGLFLSDATVLSDTKGIRLQADHPADLKVAMFPPPATAVAGQFDGVFGALPVVAPPVLPSVQITCEQESPAAAADPNVNPLDDGAWKAASSWKLHIPRDAANRHLLLGVNYMGNAARFYDGDRLLDDNLYNGAPFDVGLWRIPPDHYDRLRLKILPYTDNLAARLRSQVRAILPSSDKDKVTVDTSEQVDGVVHSSKN